MIQSGNIPGIYIGICEALNLGSFKPNLCSIPANVAAATFIPPTWSGFTGGRSATCTVRGLCTEPIGLELEKDKPIS